MKHYSEPEIMIYYFQSDDVLTQSLETESNDAMNFYVQWIGGGIS